MHEQLRQKQQRPRTAPQQAGISERLVDGYIRIDTKGTVHPQPALGNFTPLLGNEVEREVSNFWYQTAGVKFLAHGFDQSRGSTRGCRSGEDDREAASER